MANTSDPAAAEKEALQQALQKFQIFGVVVAFFVGAATIFKASVDVHSAAMRDTREQIDSAEHFYAESADHAISLGLNQQAAAVRADLLATAFEQMLIRKREVFTPPWLDGGLGSEGDRRLCNARRFAVAQHYAAADATTKDQLKGAEARVADSPEANDWKETCDRVLKPPAAAAPNPPQNVVAPTQATAMPAPKVTAPAPRLAAAKGEVLPDPGPLNQLPPNTKLGWTIDSFYCGDKNGPGYVAAARVGQLLAQRADSRTRVGGETLGLVRLKPAPAKAVGSYVVYDDVEKPFAEAIARELAGHGYAYQPSRNPSNPIRWYVSLFSCPA